MANVLPIKKRRKIRRQYILRISASLLFAVSFAFGVGATLLVPHALMSEVRLSKVIKQQASMPKQIDKAEYRKIKDTVRITNGQLEEIAELDARSPADYINEVVRIRELYRDGISVTSIRYSTERKEGTAELRVTGLAADRSVLAKFRRSIEEAEFSEEVNLPLKDLASSREIPFSITISI